MYSLVRALEAKVFRAGLRYQYVACLRTRESTSGQLPQDPRCSDGAFLPIWSSIVCSVPGKARTE